MPIRTEKPYLWERGHSRCPHIGFTSQKYKQTTKHTNNDK